MKAGARILIVEDEALIAMLLEEMLTDLGYELAGTAATLAQALELAEATELEGAILDLSLGGEKSLPVADVLAARGIPYMFASGYGRSGLEEPYASRALLRKPFDFDELEAALKAL
ncbi:MAG: hypothetical protein BGO05_12840 [Rhizobiales bacterium 63-7]|nr:response regulator [Hyphomicrobiales bacterium]OJU67128.1 MAG: hypothetical protein BGO05_12840 [Rhizobiales bacterium 63-7]